MELIKLQIVLLIICADVLLSWSMPSEMYISTGNEIIQLQASNGVNLTTRVLFDGLDEVEDLDIDRDNNTIYWVDTILRTINRASVNTSRSNGYETLIKRDILMPSCVAVDWIGGNIFFTDVKRQRIEVATADGLYRKVLIHKNLVAPTAVAVDVYSGHMFWIDNSSQPVIERASFDGSNRVIIVSNNLVNPRTLAVDYNNNGVPLLFWINTIDGHRVIEYCYTDGSSRSQLKWDSTTYPSSLSVSGDDIFWTSNSRDGTIQQFNKATNSTKTLFYQTNKTVCDLNTPPIANLTVTSNSPCAQKICDQICLTLPPGNTHKCTCSTGLKIRSNNRSCQAYPNRILFTAHDTGIKYISLDIEEDFVDISLPVEPAYANNVNNVNFGRGHNIYWTEAATELNQTSHSAIRRSALNGSNVETLVQLGLHTPTGFVIDHAAENLYWIDAYFKRIEVSRLNGSSRKVLIGSNLANPRSLAIDRPDRSLLFWSDWGNNESVPARIERAYFDGSGRDTVITFPTGVVPLGITVDISTSLLYWAASNGTIGSCSARGRKRRIIYVSDTVNTDGITIVQDYIYWIDKATGSMWKASKNNASDARIVLKGLNQLQGISSTDMSADTGSVGDCQFDNDRCSHLCLATRTGTRCDCPPGLVLSSQGKQCNKVEKVMAYSEYDDVRLVALVARLDCFNNLSGQKLNATITDPTVTIDIEMQGNRTYWIDKIEKKIYRASNVEGNQTVVVSSGLEQPYDLAVDWLGGNLYWTDRLSGRIEVSKLDGSYRRVLYTRLHNPTLIEVNPLLGILYVVTHSHIINQYQMDGQGDVIKTYSESEDYQISAMTIDYDNNQLYFKVDSEDDNPYALSRINYDFTGLLRTVLDLRETNFLYGHPLPPFAVHDESLYLISRRQDSGPRGLLFFSTGGNLLCLNTQINTPVYSTKIMHYGRQPGFHWCQIDNGDCDALCLPQKFGRYCQCPSHQIYDANLNKCKDVDDFIVFSNATGIYQLPMINDDGSSLTPQMLPLGQGEISGVEYDSYTDQLYWAQTLHLPGSDENTYRGSIRHGKLSGSGQVVVQDITLINAQWFDMQLDRAGGHVFWTLTGGSQIEVVNTNGEGLASILSHINLYPRSLAFNHEESIVYFVNWWGTTQFSSIQQLRLNASSNDVDVVYQEMDTDNNSTTSREKQDSLFYDSDDRQLYWSDSKRKAILRCSVKSLPCTDVVTVLNTDIHQSLVFSVDGDFIYWYNASEKVIYKANKYNGSNRTIFASGIINLTDFTIGHRRKQLITTVCTGEVRPCTHLCIPKGRGECACPHNYQKLPDNTTACKRAGCQENEQLCNDKSRCLPSQWVCDRHSDCPDGSDESPDHCHCQSNKFTCDSKQCAPLDAICDGNYHCLDGSDELYCDCQPGYAKCPGNNRGERCVPRTFFCDQDGDCESVNGTAFDEINCTYNSFTHTPIPVAPTVVVIQQQSSSYPAGHTIIIVVCTVMGGLIIVFLAFLILTVCYFSYGKTPWGHYKFSPSRTTHDTSSRLSTSASETDNPNSVSSMPTHLTNVPLYESDNMSYNSFLKQQQHHSVSQCSLQTAVTQEPYRDQLQPPNTPTTNKSVHFHTDSVAYQSRAESPLTFNDSASFYHGPCPSMTGAGDDMSNITSVSELAKKRYVREYVRQQMLQEQMYQRDYTADTEDYGDSTSITSGDTKMTYNSVNNIQPPPPSLASRSMLIDPHYDDDDDDGDDDD